MPIPRRSALPILKDAGIDAGRAYADAAALLKDGPFDLVLIGSPNHLHLEHLLAAFEAGFPIFCEKPIVRTRRRNLRAGAASGARERRRRSMLGL